MLDFDALVLAPCMDVFARPITVEPVASQPGEAIYAARGVYSSEPIDVATQEGGIYSDQQTTLGVRISDFDVLPVESDRVIVLGIDREYWISDVDEDGQGGAKFTLKLVELDPE